MLLRTVILQFDVCLGDRAENQQRVESMLAASWKDSDMTTAVVLPELWDVGYALESKESLADEEGSAALRFLGTLARKYNAWFVGGSVMAHTERGYVNRAQVMAPDGHLVNYYDKVHLIGLMDEDKHFTHGNRKCEFGIDGVKCAVCICYDLRFCEWLRTFAVDSANVLFISAEWPQERIEHWRTLLRARAIENQMYVVACNRVGTSKGTLFGGVSAVIDPLGNVLFEGGKSEECAIVTFDTAESAKAREALPVFSDRRAQLYFK